ncbi:hypothetical protein [Mycetocola spongiae]|uniref:hypothetical protein n=1 Tax=Mycetocola spongiae TaxID=2859226 RepID=UPI001CF2E924|nr:hypothetical protein [Mycetocola spongiae]UCR90342.1 hypothetical protein KXZ72_06760 [Mycetocola spongiae]
MSIQSLKSRPSASFLGVLGLIGVLAGLFTGVSFVNAGSANAADLSKFDPAYIISDENFYNSGSMSEQDIQRFLESKVPSCRTGNTCMINYRASTASRPADTRCSAYAGEANESAARIIAKVSAACGINPQVLLVLLQKEQGLILNSAPGTANSSRWLIATGYACPDTAACDTRYYGFYNQVYMAAWQFKVYTSSSFFTWFPVGRPSQVGYHPNAACGSSSVTIRNGATSALYYYTPYQPNRASLAAGYGTGDSCSSYGNRNFYNYYSDWFGSPTGQNGDRPPFGAFDVVIPAPGMITVRGWTIDPDTTGPVNVRVALNGVTQIYPAEAFRPDVGAAYPGFGNNHGFDIVIPIMNDRNVNVCVEALGDKAGVTPVQLGCKSVAIPDGPAPELGRAPLGSLDSVNTGIGEVTVGGWTLDPDTYDPIRVHVYVGERGTAAMANGARSDIARAYPKYGPNHGFNVRVTGVSGTQNVCAYGIDSAGKINTTLGCRVVTIEAPLLEEGRAPIGNLEVVRTGADSVTVVGWAIDPDTREPISVHVYAGARGQAFRADVPRSDIATHYPVYGANHGFNATMTGLSGTQNICVYAIDSAGRANTTLGCRTVQIEAPNTMPIGSLDNISGGNGTVEVSGWTLDPDAWTSQLAVHVYVGGAGYPIRANLPRPDLVRHYPAAGPDHGFSRSIPAVAGNHNVCVYALDSVSGNTMLGCKVVTVN